ncbi:MAG: hypothetical protein KatS3mg016_1814 [Fimbriimonadales bacterium]|nr:MAG: hypothetical protein KatS3mg016_1814 [Fimbriimonadales bacterium]
MKRWILMSFAALIVMFHLAACGNQGGEGEAAAPPTTNPMGQQPTPDTPGAAAEERKAGGY